MRPRVPEPADHGAHTLRVVDGTIVGIDGDDVFVELGPRMQGVISARAFAREPAVGDEHRFTLRGQEEGLWALSLVEQPVLATWENMEVGSLVQVRVVRVKPGGLEVKIGALHAFLPKSQTGLDRGEDPAALIGKVITCEVTEVDAERQRCAVSRKRVLQRERESEQAREIGSLAPGAVVHGRVTRIEDYGAFVRFGHGLEGLVHVSNLAWERVAHPSEVVKQGDAVVAKVLHVKRGGKRIGLGLKQMGESPWNAFAREVQPGSVVLGTVTRLADYGAFVRVRKGVEGLLHRSQAGLGPDEPVHKAAYVGSELAVRVLSIDPDEGRLSLSLFAEDGRRVDPEDVETARAAIDYVAESGDRAPGTDPMATDLGRRLRDALTERNGSAPHVGGANSACSRDTTRDEST